MIELITDPSYSFLINSNAKYQLLVSARTVITGDPNLSLDEVGVPMPLAWRRKDLHTLLQSKVMMIVIYDEDLWQDVLSDGGFWGEYERGSR